MRGRGTRGATRAALIALAILLVPGAVAASADTLGVNQRVLTLAGNPSTIVLSPGTSPNAYRFESAVGRTIDVTGDAANALCGPDGRTVECRDDSTLAIPNDDIVSITINGEIGDDIISKTGPLPTVSSVLLNGGAGADRIVGGVGRDVIVGGSGNDTIEARDGDNADGITCGDATDADTVTADPGDTIAGCETITPPPPPPPPPPVAPPTPPTPPPAAPFVPSGQQPTGPPIAVGVSAAFSITRSGTRVSRLTVKDVPAGVVLRVSCKSPIKLRGGQKCPFRAITIPMLEDTEKVALAKRFKNRRLAWGTVINIYGAAVGRVGTSVKFTIRRNGSPGRSDGCINPAFKRISCLSVNPFSRLTHADSSCRFDG